MSDDVDPLTELGSLLRMVQLVKDSFAPPVPEPPHDLLEVAWEILRTEFKTLRTAQLERINRRQ